MTRLVAKSMGMTRQAAEERYQVDGARPVPLPEWVREVYRHQVQAVGECVAAFEAGTKVVQLDAPTGTGKSLIADLVRRALGVERGLYACTTKSLQVQIADTFAYARVLKGRANYTPTKLTTSEKRGGRGWSSARDGLSVTCADCDASGGEEEVDKTCSYCEFVEDCPYLVARREAMGAAVGVVNTAYLLAEANGPGRTRGRGLVVLDEAHGLERALMGYVELRVGKGVAGRLGVEVPKKGSHMTTIRSWLEDEVQVAIKEKARGLGKGLEDQREARGLERLAGDVARVIARPDGWVREGGEEDDARQGDALVLKPVSVEDMGQKVLWRHADRFLLMSGTTVSAEQQADVLGMEQPDEEIPWAKVSVPGLFPKENRRVVYAPVALMTRKGLEEGAMAKMLTAIERVLAKHPGDNILIHTHTYANAKQVTASVKAWAKEGDGRPVFTYDSSWGRDGALERFKGRADKGGAVLVAASMDEGVDLPGDTCRVQIIVKMPFASLGSRQVSERLRGAGGQVWYLCDTVRSVQQMTGRAVRGMEDWAVCYILDSSFGKVLGDGKRLGMFPDWWLNGLEVGKMREFV